MKIVDLIIKIAKGEEVPKKIIYKNVTLEYDEKSEDYYPCYDRGLFEYLFTCDVQFLNDEVEIIEEDKKIEKIEIVNNGNMNAYAIYGADGTKCALTKHSKVMCDKINELIDKVNSLEDKQ